MHTLMLPRRQKRMDFGMGRRHRASTGPGPAGVDSGTAASQRAPAPLGAQVPSRHLPGVFLADPTARGNGYCVK